MIAAHYRGKYSSAAIMASRFNARREVGARCASQLHAVDVAIERRSSRLLIAVRFRAQFHPRDGRCVRRRDPSREFAAQQLRRHSARAGASVIKRGNRVDSVAGRAIHGVVIRREISEYQRLSLDGDQSDFACVDSCGLRLAVW